MKILPVEIYSAGKAKETIFLNCLIGFRKKKYRQLLNQKRLLQLCRNMEI